MTLTVHLTPEQVDRLQVEADRTGIPLTAYVRQLLLGDASQLATDASQLATDDASRLSAIDAAMGALADSGISSEDFMNEKQVEVAHEEARWQERCGSP
jgi:nitric oxide reductase activation protein